MEKDADLEILKEDGITVLVVKGYINKEGGEHIAVAVEQAIQDGTHGLVFDLEECRIVNSIGVSILIEIIEKISEDGGKVVFCCLKPTVHKTLRIMGLLQAASACDTRDEAVRQLTS